MTIRKNGPWKIWLKHLFAQKTGDKQKPYCPLYQTHDHLSVNCTIVTALVDSKKFFIFVLIAGVQTTEQTNALCMVVYSANTGIIPAYVIDRRGETAAAQTQHHWQATLITWRRQCFLQLFQSELKGKFLWAQLHLTRNSRVVKVKANRSRDAQDLYSQWNQSPVHANLWFPH